MWMWVCLVGCVCECAWVDVYVGVLGWMGVRGGGLRECVWRCGCTYCAVTRVVRRHTCTLVASQYRSSVQQYTRM